MVPMDPTLIEQVIMNLLENAWVHSGSDAPIEFDIKEEGNKLYSISVTTEMVSHQSAWINCLTAVQVH